MTRQELTLTDKLAEIDRRNEIVLRIDLVKSHRCMYHLAGEPELARRELAKLDRLFAEKARIDALIPAR